MSIKKNFALESPAGPKPNSWDDLDDLKQLECLIRANTVLGQMSGRSSREHIDYALKAYYSAFRLIQVAIENGLQAWKEIQKQNLQGTGDGQEKGDGKKKQAAAGGAVNESGKKSNLGEARGILSVIVLKSR